MNDALHAELLAAFEAELAEHLAAIRATIADAAAGRAFDVRDASRRAHSLKGAARAVEQPRTEELSHEAEAILLALEEDDVHPDAATLTTLRQLVDRIEDAARGDEPAATTTATATADARVRVDGEQVDTLVRSLQMLADQFGDQATLPAQIGDLQGELTWLARAQAQRGDRELGGRLSRIAASLGRLRQAQVRQHGEVQRTLDTLERDAERVMLVPVAMLFDGHDRMVREIGAAQGKEVALHIDGDDGEADRRVLQMLRDPLLHILRNAVSHGIEPPDIRLAAGKPAAGKVQVEVATGNGRLTISVRDDGRGLDDARIETRARAIGLIAPGEATPPRRRLHPMVLRHGFSTAETVDAVSGRGVGLAVVADIAERLHGKVDIAPAPGGGTTITLSVPLTLTRQTMVVAQVGDERYAIPSAGVARVLRIDPARIERVDRRDRVLVDDRSIAVGRLGAIAGIAAEAGTDAAVALLLRAGTHEAVLIVDRLVDVRAVVIGTTASLAFDVPLVQGTARIEGAIVPVLRVDALVDSIEHGRSAPAAIVAAAPARRQQTILVVDDSITTRTLERSILEAEGYRVLVSVDGLEALDRLKAGGESIELVVSDVEMPRLDGFGLLAAIRNDPALQSLPVVMMTSRNRPDDIDRGLTLGASAYVTKQDFDQGALIEILRQLV